MSSYREQAQQGVAAGRELKGPRPTPLKVNKDSRGIRKPPVPPPPQQRPPVIIYMRSPKIIHTKPRDFMALVQRLTGKSPTSQPPPPLSTVPAITKMPPVAPSAYFPSSVLDGTSIDTGISEEMNLDIEPYLSDDIIIDAWPSQMLPPKGIISPAPSSLTSTPLSFFLPSPKPSPNLLELTPILYTPTYQENRFLSPMQRPHGIMSMNSTSILYTPTYQDNPFLSPMQGPHGIMNMNSTSILYTPTYQDDPFLSPMQRPQGIMNMNSTSGSSCLDSFTSLSDLYRIQ